MSRKAWIIGGTAVAVVGVGAAVLLSRPAAAKEPRKKGPRGTMGEVVDETFLLTAEGFRSLICDAREADSGDELAEVLKALRKAAKQSGAETVNVSSTGVVDRPMSAAEFDEQIGQAITQLEGLGRLEWAAASLVLQGKLNGMPDCDAKIAEWEEARAIPGIKMSVVSRQNLAWGTSAAVERFQRS